MLLSGSLYGRMGVVFVAFGWRMTSSIFTGSHLLSLAFLLRLLIPGHGRLMCPFGVAGDGARYRWMSLGFMSGILYSWPLLVALSKVVGGKLKNIWCIYFICCCLCGSVHKDINIVCLTVPSAAARLKCSAGFWTLTLDRLIGSHHNRNWVPTSNYGKFPMWYTLYLSPSNDTQQPVSQNFQVDMGDECTNPGTMCASVT